MDDNKLVNSDVLSAAIKQGGITLDDEAVQGAYNLVFNERRMKVQVELLAHQPDFNRELVDELTQARRLDDFTVDSDNFKMANSIIYDKKKILEAFSNERMWGNAYEHPDMFCTFSPMQAGLGKLIPHSAMMVEIIFASLVSLVDRRTENQEYDMRDWLRQDKYYYELVELREGLPPSEHTMIKRRKPKYEIRFREDKPKYEFFRSFYNIIDFLMRGMEIENGAEYAGEYQALDAGETLKTYLADILPELAGFDAFAANDDNWQSNEVRSTLPPGIHTTVKILSSYRTLSVLFRGMHFVRLDGKSNQVGYPAPAWRLLDLFLCSISEAKEIAGQPHLMFANKIGVVSCYYHQVSTNWMLRIAMFLASILKYSWHESESIRYVRNGYMRTSLSKSANYTNCCLWHQNRHVLRGTVGFTQSAQVVQGHWSNYNVHISSSYDLITRCVLKINDIKCLKNITYPASPENNVYFGKVQVRTFSDNEDERPNFIAHDNPYPEESLFQPVKRVYVHATDGVEYDLFCDNIDLDTLSASHIDDFALATCGFAGKNWLYFDNIDVREYGCNYDNPTETYFDPIPIFDVRTDALQDGTYAYADHFKKFFTSEPSRLTEIITTLYDDNVPIFLGLLDFSSIAWDRRRVSFTATDAIGVIAENIKAITGCIAWAEYSSNLTSHAALPYCGTTIHGFMNFILRGGVFGVFKNLEVPQFINNKLLNDISAETAFTVAVQCLRKLVRCNYRDSSIEFVDIDGGAEPTVIPEDRVVSQSFSMVDNYRDRFSGEALEGVAGKEALIKDVSLFYNQLFTNKNTTVSAEILGEGLNIKVLDKISIGSMICIVMSVSRNIRRKTITISGVRIQ